MKIGVTFPQTEIGDDPGAIREYACEVERMGFDHILAYDHVLGAGRATRPDWQGPYDLNSMFHEPFVLFSYLAGVTSRLGFVSGVMILSQRQTALVAKQAACLDVLSEGRLRLGIGTGWNEVEYQALGVPFGDRGRRLEDQVAVLRALWTQASVTRTSEFHTIEDAGLCPLPVQRPIPLWFGGGSDRPRFGNQPARDGVIRRIARLADGWIPQWQPNKRGQELLDRMRTFARDYGRDPASIGIEGRFIFAAAGESSWEMTLAAWRRIGASHLAIDTMGDGLRGAEAHLRRLEHARALCFGG
jgi:probable F420-dependent oxidoreductase